MKNFTVLNPIRNVMIFCGRQETGKTFLASKVIALVHDDVSNFNQDLVEEVKKEAIIGNFVIIITNDVMAAFQYYNAFSPEVQHENN